MQIINIDDFIRLLYKNEVYLSYCVQINEIYHDEIAMYVISCIWVPKYLWQISLHIMGPNMNTFKL